MQKNMYFTLVFNNLPMLSYFFYSLFLKLYHLAARALAIKNKKANFWVQGRQQIWEKISLLKKEKLGNGQILWVHCASLGEFEQARPIIEAIKQQMPQFKIILSFFSPSGYEIRKNYNKVDTIVYLPIDGKNNAEKFIDIVKPTLVIWVKYEYWHYYIQALKQKQIPAILVSAIFRPNQPFFKWYGSLWRKTLQSFTKIYVQDEDSKALLQSLPMPLQIEVAGDTRFDRVLEIANNTVNLPKPIVDFCTGSNCLVAGSTWEDDEELISHYIKANPTIKCIIAPHQIEEEHLIEIEKLLPKAVRYSDFINGKEATQIILIDNIGMLSKLYSLATIAYIGGGFTESGIHNSLEAAVYGLPLVFGPEYFDFKEAVEMVENGIAFSINDALAFEKFCAKVLSHETFAQELRKATKNYVQQKAGATKLIMQHVKETYA
jgi:3-deoxy-D-manno-octulosonic-acid transferase